MASPIDLAILQELASPYFEQWDEAVGLGDAASANTARRNIMALGKSEIKNCSELAAVVGGLYVFVDKAGGTPDRVRYVGLVKRQTLATRMQNYFCEELSVLDRLLPLLPEADARTKIANRIQAAMPNSSKLADYTRSHMKSWRLAKAAKVFLFPCEAAENVIEDAETVLIISATSLGAPLINRQKNRSVPIGIGAELAKWAIEKWQADGLDKRLCDQWAANAAGFEHQKGALSADKPEKPGKR